MAWLVKYSDSPIRLHCHIFRGISPVGQHETRAFGIEVFSLGELIFASWCLHQSYKLKGDTFPLLIFFFLFFSTVPLKYFACLEEKIRVAHSLHLAYTICCLVCFYQTMVRGMPRTINPSLSFSSSQLLLILL